MFEFFRSLGATIRSIFEPRFVGRFHDSYKGPRTWWIHVNPNKYRHVYIIYVTRFVREELYSKHGFNGLLNISNEDMVEEDFRNEMKDLLDNSGSEWTTVEWSPVMANVEEKDIWVVATATDDWLMYAKLRNSRLAEKMFYDHDQI